VSDLAISAAARLWRWPRKWVGAGLFVAGVFFVAAGGPAAIALSIGLLVLCALVAAAAQFPQFAVLGLVIWVPLQQPVLAFLYKLGAPVLVVRDLGYLKEFWTVSLVVAAWRATRSQRIKADLLDWAAVLYVGIATLFLVLPFADSSALGGVSFAGRLHAWRLDCLYVVILITARRLTFAPVVLRRLRLGLCIVGIILGGFSVWEIIDGASFTNFLRNTLEYSKYKADVFGVGTTSDLLIHGSIGDSTFVRAGSLFNDPLSFGFFMVIPFAVALERVAARKGAALGTTVAVAGLVGVIFSGTRGAAIAAGVGVILALVFGPSRVAPNRLRLLVAVLLGAVVLLPFAGQSTLVDRLVSLTKPASETHSNEVHVARTRAGWTALLERPLGRGLGANSQTGARYGTTTAITTEDAYLQTGAEFGVPGLLVFVGFLVVALVELRRRATLLVEHSGLAGGVWLAGCGLMLGALTLQVWTELTVTLVFGTLTGVALSKLGGAERQRAPEPAQTA
jgi:hypothetical protein